MTDNIEKDIRNMLAIKHDIIKILIENETDNKYVRYGPKRKKKGR